MDQLLTIHQIASYLKVSPRTGDLPEKRGFDRPGERRRKRHPLAGE
jgi:hypothetical protein